MHCTFYREWCHTCGVKFSYDEDWKREGSMEDEKVLETIRKHTGGKCKIDYTPHSPDTHGCDEIY